MNVQKSIRKAILIIGSCFLLTGCHMNHEWQEATCTQPSTCTIGGETEGEALGHSWVEATCTEAKHCSVCGEVEGETLEHTWIEATCAMARHCDVCGETEGEALPHTLTEANYQQPATCTVCGGTEGEPLPAYFEEEGLECVAEIGIRYPYPVECSVDRSYITTGKVHFSDYEIFVSDDTHEALEGYEWRAVTITFQFTDDNAYAHGYFARMGMYDYYVDEENEENEENFSDPNFYESEPYTINYNGVDYEECLNTYERLRNGWVARMATEEWRVYFRVPVGYDGCVVGARTERETEARTENDLYFRLL